MITAKCKKDGKANVTFKIKNKSYKIAVSVHKYKNPITSVTIGDKKISGSKFNKKDKYVLKYYSFKNKKMKIKMNLKKGWFVDQVIFNNLDDKNHVKIKNGSTIKLRNDMKAALLFFYVQNEKTGQRGYLTILFE